MVATIINNKAEIITNDFGNRVTPSVVAFTEIERLTGDAAKNQMILNPLNTIFDVKRIIGRNFDDQTLQFDMKTWPFEVIDDGNNNPLIRVEYRNEVRTFSPEELSAMILLKMKQVAEMYLGKYNTLKKAVYVHQKTCGGQ